MISDTFLSWGSIAVAIFGSCTFLFKQVAADIFLFSTKKYFQLYQIRNPDSIKIIMSNVGDNSTKRDENDKPIGCFYGGWYKDFYYGYITESAGGQYNNHFQPEMTLHIYCSKKFYKNICGKVEETANTIKHMVKNENGYSCKWRKTFWDVTKFTPREDQKEIISDIIFNFNQNDNKFFCLIYGPPGTGKSMIGILLAKQVKGWLVRSYNPTLPHNTLKSIYYETKPTQEQPLVIVIDEIDCILKKIHDGGIKTKTDTPREVFDKESWNRLCDDIHLEIYKYTYIIGTMNSSPDDMNKLDDAYLRKNRIHKMYKMETENPIQEKVEEVEVPIKKNTETTLKKLFRKKASVPSRFLKSN